MKTMNITKKWDWKKVYCLLSFSLTLFLVDIAIYYLLAQLSMQQCWIALPVILYGFLTFAGKFVKRTHIVATSLEITSIISFLILFISIKIYPIAMWIESYFEIIAFIIILALFMNLLISKSKKSKKSEVTKEDCSNQLFNLFYLNTSKAHEIAMLIDNKIMKTIEREQVSEELLRYHNSASIGKKDIISADIGYSLEDSSKKRVYENFDVKTTKSIMLRKIYKTAQNEKLATENLQVGALTVFKDIELKQLNIDDTVMILNVLQDSKIKNQSDDNLEINLNKMMDKMLDDFTIDYTFKYKQDEKESEPFIIQIPYKATDNFENGYQHNDLQLGKLSVIGIYRGQIDFSKRDSISSKFLDIMSKSYNQEIQNNKDLGEMKLSYNGSNKNDIPFEFDHKKLKGKMHLIDVIAIIQELNFDRNE